MILQDILLVLRLYVLLKGHKDIAKLSITEDQTAEQNKGKTVRCIHLFHCFYTEAYSNNNRVEPVYNCHPWDLTNWLLNTGSLKILRRRGLMSILMAYHAKTLQARNSWTK